MIQKQYNLQMGIVNLKVAALVPDLTSSVFIVRKNFLLTKITQLLSGISAAIRWYVYV